MAQVPAETQDNTAVDAPPSVDRTVPAAPWAVGRIYVTDSEVVPEDFRVVVKAEALARVKPP